eukprot:TRINITY_DN16907_c0_g1_i1.p1 TRINITY_DN16907_c0_g1~~TRINITY_DN16907_c0_g1_i1.p1  ORF type:complete len:107 (+),score=3.04 TRINITY_DN16907_c0_g1_i1:33-353(+)
MNSHLSVLLFLSVLLIFINTSIHCKKIENKINTNHKLLELEEEEITSYFNGESYTNQNLRVYSFFFIVTGISAIILIGSCLVLVYWGRKIYKEGKLSLSTLKSFNT